MKYLLDEDLTPLASVTLQQEDIDIIHLRDRGLSNQRVPDHAVLELAYEEDRVLLTANVHDFRRLGAAREIQAGIILFEAGDTPRDEQVAAIRAVIRQLEASGDDLVNRIVLVREDGTLTEL